MKNVDREERELLESFEAGEWVPVRDRERDLARYRRYAEAASRKSARVNIRLSERDLRRIKERALREGIPYQTLIASVLHKYGAGTLREVPEESA